MRSHPNRYANHDGPPRAIRNLDDWTQEGGRADRDLDAAIDEREGQFDVGCGTQPGEDAPCLGELLGA